MHNGERTSKGSWQMGHSPAAALASTAFCASSAALLAVGEYTTRYGWFTAYAMAHAENVRIAFHKAALSGSPCCSSLAPWSSEMFDASWSF